MRESYYLTKEETKKLSVKELNKLEAERVNANRDKVAERLDKLDKRYGK